MLPWTSLLLIALSGSPDAPAAAAPPPRASSGADKPGKGEDDYRHQFMMGLGMNPDGVALFVTTRDRRVGDGPPRFVKTMECQLYLIPFRSDRLGGAGTRARPSRLWLPTRGLGMVLEVWTSPEFWKSMDDLAERIESEERQGSR